MRRLVLLSLLLIASAPVASADSCWNHQGSVVKLKIDRQQTVLSYDQPRAELARFGISKGSSLFKGTTSGSQMFGDAFQYSTACPGQPHRYQVSGGIEANGKHFRLQGSRIRLEDCKPSGQLDQVELRFDFIREC